ncbi:MAG: STAS domain-containing protein [Candidatus Eisenbacteria bacterium]|uniref:Anti-sigma factor antagonist n=1 Tax=Eiseniibacteriota bacterium TaxID=2212470 RepID=A0A7Y2EA56_UNCEI|nr:STAS domain-containing protein [Candidatus Eisenbacteria bacterium]
MKISRNDRDGIAILKLEGKIMGGPDADLFQTQVKDLLAEGQNKVLLDLGKVSWVNSTGLGILISGHKTIENSGGSMKLLGVNKRIDQIFMVTRLNTVFEAFDDEADAMASF